jgi:hypothetical protein
MSNYIKFKMDGMGNSSKNASGWLTIYQKEQASTHRETFLKH